MYPKQIVLRDFVYNIARFSMPSYRFDQVKDNEYLGEITPCKELLGAVFIYKDKAYKIESVQYGADKKSLLTNRVYVVTTISVVEYSDDKVKNILSRLKGIREQLLVCSDAIQDLGGFPVAQILLKLVDKLDSGHLV